MSSHQKQRTYYIVSGNRIKGILFGIFTLIFLSTIFTYEKAYAGEKHYSIMIGDADKNYTYYSYNNEETALALEISSEGKLMIPAWAFAKQSAALTYSYNKETNSVIIKNTVNKKSIKFVKGASKATVYSALTKTTETIAVESPVYISKISKAVMVPAALLHYIMEDGGYHYYNQSAMTACGYDTTDTYGVFVYNPYTKVTKLPKATSVSGIPYTVTVTIPEGYSISQIFNLLVKKGVCKSTDLLFDACENYDFSYYPLVAALPKSSMRCFRLEGLLFPDTYEFYHLMSGEDIIGKFLRNSESKLSDLSAEAEDMGYSLYDVLTVASIIEKETGSKKEKANIASVIYNRLDANMKLQMDCCSYYIERYVKPYLTGDINRFNSYYNTYKCSTLPAGPICNPGMVSIHAALHPADTDYYYFCASEDGTYYYAATYEEHLKNLEQIKNQ